MSVSSLKLKKSLLDIWLDTRYLAMFPFVKKSNDFKGRIDDPSPEKNIICRCEKVTEAEIADAVRRPLGAHSTDAMKRRTRAGMGPCQGSFCESRVAAVIGKELNIPVEKVGRHSSGSSILPHRGKITDEDKQLLVEIARLAKL